MGVKRDEWQAFCRDWVKEQPEEDLVGLMKQLIDGTEEQHSHNHRITCHLALLGLVAAWISAEEEAEAAQ